MLGFATVDSRPGAGTTVVWLTSLVSDRGADHTNAVDVADSDPDRLMKLDSLISNSVVLMTKGSEPPDIVAYSISLESIEGLLSETERQQQRISEAIMAHGRKTHNKNLVQPSYPKAPVPNEFELDAEDPICRTLGTANYLKSVWNSWIATEHQRVRRSTSPRTGETPWMMPADMSSTTIDELPVSLDGTLRPQPVSQC